MQFFFIFLVVHTLSYLNYCLTEKQKEWTNKAYELLLCLFHDFKFTGHLIRLIFFGCINKFSRLQYCPSMPFDVPANYSSNREKT